jgi:hypothetical protein
LRFALVGGTQRKSIGVAAREQQRRPHQALAPGGEEFLGYRDALGGRGLVRPVARGRLHTKYE